MAQTIEAQLLDALELFQYSYRFRHALFVLALEPDVSISRVLMDLRVLHSSHISVMIICKDGPDMSQTLRKWSERGIRFSYLRGNAAEPITAFGEEVIHPILEEDVIPVLGLDQTITEINFHLYSLELADRFGADKAFFISTCPGLEIDGVLQSHISAKELSALLHEMKQTNVPGELLTLFCRQSQEKGVDIVLLEGTPGNLFQEIFTHQGKGTLFTDEYPNVVRRAQLDDVFEISLLLKPYIAAGIILPTSEDSIAECVGDYFLYTVNEAIVAASQLVDYGTACALARFCTLPRFQGKGRAKQLAREMIEAAKTQGKDYVFALSVEPKIWTFFRSLGFSEVPREELPASWKVGYDFQRPSKAFAFYF